MAGVVALFAAGATAGRGARRAARGKYGPRRIQFGPSDVELIQQTLVGMPKADVALLIGPPAAATDARGQARIIGDQECESDLWYYPVDRRTRLFAVIQFDQDMVQQVHCLRHAPSRFII